MEIPTDEELMSSLGISQVFHVDSEELARFTLQGIGDVFVLPSINRVSPDKFIHAGEVIIPTMEVDVEDDVISAIAMVMKRMDGTAGFGFDNQILAIRDGVEWLEIGLAATKNRVEKYVPA